MTAAFQGQVLNRPSGRAGELPVKEALLVQYLGVYAPPPSVAQLGKNNQAGGAAARLHGRAALDGDTPSWSRPDGTTRAGRLGHARSRARTASPGRRSTPRARGAGGSRPTDDQNRQSIAERPFQVDYTLSALKVPSVAHALKVGFTLSRAASVTLQIETKDGAVVAKLPAGEPRGGHAVARLGRHDDERREGAAGSYVARVVATSAVGTSELAAPFALRR